MIPVLVPFRTDSGRRAAIWHHLRQHYWSSSPVSSVIIEGDAAGPFNRSVALNLASSLAGPWELAIIADADTYVAAPQLLAAIERARTGRLVIAHTQWRNLSEVATLGILAGDDLTEPEYDRTCEGLHAVSGMLVVPRGLWDMVGGFDERFVGYGWEESAFARAAEVAGGKVERIDGPCWHLNHERERRDQVDYAAGRIRYLRYAHARTVPELQQVRRGR